MAKMNRKSLRKLILEMAYADSDNGVKTFYPDEEGGVPNMPSALRRALETGRAVDATEIMTRMEDTSIPDIREVARALFNGFILDASDLGPMPATAAPLKFYIVMSGELILVGKISLDDGIALSNLGEHPIVVYPASLKDF